MGSKKLKIIPASTVLKALKEKPKNEKTTIANLMRDFHENGIMLAMIFFSLPIAIPLPYPPGFTTLVGIPLMILSIQLLIGSRVVRLPQRVNEYTIKNSTLNMISEKIVPILEFIEQYIKPRFGFARSVYSEQFVGLVSLIASIAVSIPLPFTNAIPALGITIMSLGQMNRDGLIIFCGVAISAFGVAVAMLAVVGSLVFIKSMFSFIF